ncbi:MAG: hypothetical protein WBV23_04540 [Desulfobaccales bacterium]
MRGRAAWLGVAVMMAVLGIALVGCATGPTSSPVSSQADLLTQAGFRIHSANTPQKLAYVKTLPAKKVVLNQYQDKPLYLVCTDPDAKQCFLGDEAAYQRYEQLAIQQSISEDQHKVEEHRWDPEALQMWVDSQGGG